MLWYRITDFLKTRMGHLSLFAVAVIALFFMAIKYFKKREDTQQLVASEFPRLPNEGGWEGDSKAPITHDPTEPEIYQHEHPNEDFTPIRPPVLLPEKLLVVQQEPESPAEPEVQEAFIPLAPLIQFQGRASQDNPPAPEPQFDAVKEETPLPKPPTLNLEAGAILYAQLLAPLSSELNNALVNATLTRALVRGGKILAPKGAALIGSLQQSSHNRLFLADDWKLQFSDGSWVTLRGQTQESSLDPTTGRYTLNDGRAGLPGLAQPKDQQVNPLWAKTLKTLAVVSGRLAQDRVRTAIGDHIPGTARNAVLEGTTQIIEQNGLPFLKEPTKQSPTVIVEAGRQFYLKTIDDLPD